MSGLLPKLFRQSNSVLNVTGLNVPLDERITVYYLSADAVNSSVVLPPALNLPNGRIMSFRRVDSNGSNVCLINPAAGDDIEGEMFVPIFAGEVVELMRYNNTGWRRIENVYNNYVSLRSSSTTPDGRANFLSYNSTGGDIAVTLPDSSTLATSRWFLIKNNGSANNVNISPAVGDTIGGGPGPLAVAGGSRVFLVADANGDWDIF